MSIDYPGRILKDLERRRKSKLDSTAANSNHDSGLPSEVSIEYEEAQVLKREHGKSIKVDRISRKSEPIDNPGRTSLKLESAMRSKLGSTAAVNVNRRHQPIQLNQTTKSDDKAQAFADKDAPVFTEEHRRRAVAGVASTEPAVVDDPASMGFGSPRKSKRVATVAIHVNLDGGISSDPAESDDGAHVCTKKRRKTIEVEDNFRKPVSIDEHGGT